MYRVQTPQSPDVTGLRIGNAALIPVVRARPRRERSRKRIRREDGEVEDPRRKELGLPSLLSVSFYRTRRVPDPAEKGGGAR